MSLTDIVGIEVGHWTEAEGRTGCTVVVLPEPNVVAVETRGAAPGSRETALLQPGMKVEQVQAILLTGGSAFGLAAADGVMRELEADGRGHSTPLGPVPIVPAAVIFDLQHQEPSIRPGAQQGAAAYRAKTAAPVESGSFGAGAGATVAKWRGFENARPGGVGSASVVIDEVTLSVMVVVNAIGDVFDIDGTPLTGGPHVPTRAAVPPDPFTSTTLMVVATDALLSRTELHHLNVRAHDALAACVRPAHTRYDGDTAFAVSAGSKDGDLDALGAAAFEATAKAIVAAVSRESHA